MELKMDACVVLCAADVALLPAPAHLKRPEEEPDARLAASIEMGSKKLE